MSDDQDVDGQFSPIRRIAAANLNAATPLGLFRPFGGRGVLFWVVEEGAARTALVLEGHPSGAIAAMPLDAGTEDWQGISLGPVEVEIDDRSAVRSDGMPPRGAIVVSNGAASVAVRDGHRVSYVRVGDAVGTPASVAAYFTRWRLVWRDAAGRTRTLYVKDG